MSARLTKECPIRQLLPLIQIRCLIPDFDGAVFSREWKEALKARFSRERHIDRGGPSSDTTESREPEGSGKAVWDQPEDRRQMEEAAALK